jgi:hypothetical protein
MWSTESKQKQTFSPRRNLVHFQNPTSGNQTEKTQTKKKSRLEHQQVIVHNQQMHLHSKTDKPENQCKPDDDDDDESLSEND